MYRVTEWTWLVRFRPDMARRRLVAALRRARGNATAAAQALGIDRVTLWRYARTLGLSETLDEIRRS